MIRGTQCAGVTGTGNEVDGAPVPGDAVSAPASGAGGSPAARGAGAPPHAARKTAATTCRGEPGLDGFLPGAYRSLMAAESKRTVEREGTTWSRATTGRRLPLDQRAVPEQEPDEQVRIASHSQSPEHLPAPLTDHDSRSELATMNLSGIEGLALYQGARPRTRVRDRARLRDRRGGRAERLRKSHRRNSRAGR